MHIKAGAVALNINKQWQREGALSAGQQKSLDIVLKNIDRIPVCGLNMQVSLLFYVN